MKNCIKCKKEKEITEFYAHPKMSDGHLGMCKACVKTRAKSRHHKLMKDPEWAENEKTRNREKFHRLHKNWKQSDPEIKRKARAKWADKYPEKIKAGDLSRKIKCPKGYEKHHWSYEEKNAKDVIIVERDGHYYFHRHHIYDQEQMAFRNNKGVLMNKEDNIDFLDANKFKFSYFTTEQK